MKKKKAYGILLEARENITNVLNDKTGITDIGCWQLESWTSKTPELAPEVKATIIKHLNTYFHSWVLPKIDEVIEELEK